MSQQQTRANSNSEKNVFVQKAKKQERKKEKQSKKKQEENA